MAISCYPVEILKPSVDAQTIRIVGNNREFLFGHTYQAINTAVSASASRSLATDITLAIHNYNIENNNIHPYFINWGWDGGLQTQINLAFAAGSGPDIITGEAFMPLHMMNGNLRPFPDDLAEHIRATVLPSSYQAMTNNGRMYGVAVSYSPVMMMWNRTLISNRLGADHPRVNTPPATWSEFLDVGTEIRTATNNSVGLGGPYAGNNMSGFLRSSPFLFQMVDIYKL